MNTFRIFFLTALLPFAAAVAETNVPEAEPSTFSLFSFFDEENLDSDAVFDDTLSSFEEDLQEISKDKIEEIFVSTMEDPVPALSGPAEASFPGSSPVMEQPLSSAEPKNEALPEVTAQVDLAQQEAKLVLDPPLVQESKALEIAAPVVEAKAVEATPKIEVAKAEENQEPESLADPADELASLEKDHFKSDENLIADSSLLNLGGDETVSSLEINLRQVFAGSPVIYTLLLVMSMGAVFIWLYNLISLKYAGQLPDTVLKPLRHKLISNQYDEALSLCAQNESLFCKMVSMGIHSRRYGVQVMLEAMKAEGKRATTGYWQRMGLLNDIAIIAPMIGLLGTVLGMFYAFYDLNRTTESVTTLFDGLGISVGTTVAGLVVAILAMILQSTAKYRTVRQLARVENEAYALASLIENKVPGGN